jgi:ribose 5-phosphate isomerase A
VGDVGIEGIEREKEVAAAAGALLVEDGMAVGLGTGSTVAYLLPALAARGLSLTCVATSPGTEARAVALGLSVVAFEDLDHLDLALDGADQVDATGWLVKGGGGAHTRERIVAAASDQFVVIVSSNKLVERVEAPVPLELEEYAVPTIVHTLPAVRLREGAPMTPDDGLLADYWGEVGDPAELAATLAAVPGVISHGLFPPSMVDQVLVGREERVETLRFAKGAGSGAGSGRGSGPGATERE